MAKRTTDDWQALLDGATEGPWEWDKCHSTWKQASPEENALIPERKREVTVTLATPVEGAGIAATSDATLAAAAPEAVAEVVRLRRELEELLRECIDSANAAEGNARNATNWEALQAVAYTDRDTADAITRILGDNNH